MVTILIDEIEHAFIDQYHACRWLAERLGHNETKLMYIMCKEKLADNLLRLQYQEIAPRVHSNS